MAQAPVVHREGHPAIQSGEGGASPILALQPWPLFGPMDMRVRAIPHRVARKVCEQKHYLRSYPGGSELAFGIFSGDLLLGVAVLGVGPKNISSFFQDAQGKEVMCLSRFWLDDRLGRNCESRALAIILRSLRRHQGTVKAVVAYSDPMAGHNGTIYRAAGFLYLGQSQPTHLYRMPDGGTHHSRSLSHSYGTHSVRHFAAHGVAVELLPQAPKLIYVALVDPRWRERLERQVLHYPKEGRENEDRRDTH